MSADELQKSRHHITNSTAWLLLRLCGGIFLFETAFVPFIALLLSPALGAFLTEVTLGLWVLQTVKFFLLCALTIVIVTPWASTQYYLTDQQLIKYVGLARRDEEIFDLDTLKSLSLHQGWFGRLFNYGDISLVFASSGYQTNLELRGAYNPKKYERHLRARLGEF